ncbi:MAG: hypothetical protein AAFN91_18455 [Pseudomonadota bacterium]
MAFTNVDAEAYLDANHAHIERLRKTITNLTTTHHVLYFFEKLEHMKVEDFTSVTEDWMMEMEAYLTTISVSYGRLFAESKGARVLKKKLIPKHLQEAHDEVIALRNERYAHHGDHITTAPELELLVNEKEVLTHLHWRSNMPNGAPLSWKDLFLWADNFLKASFQKQMAYMSQTSGKEWVPFEPDFTFRQAHVIESAERGLPSLMDSISKLKNST